MDEDAQTLLNTVFYGRLDPKDLYVISRKLFGESPIKTLFCRRTDTGEVFIDFLFREGLASKFLGIPAQETDARTCDRTLVARELMEVAVIDDDTEAYADASEKVRSFLKAYRNKPRIRRLREAHRRLSAGRRCDYDLEFIRDVVY
ncbi:crescent membrane and immature virion formation [Eastern grey kangaroopox virus]|uniref:Crescent membrane and immature virion formation n=1 Tax=Eastern grey kangaroopox virus TaxID=2042482 RepID=A0A2C9DT53_9POXV|nr:crescent membrane and immature virion formation [Eastern grey kangaroopox virus]ATI21186.1 crescent membrane and immature virion formation [Eastern grey kangaroopox virus]ATX75092.1 crescent membrane and immature virion formation [Eastern grey kangaroopox virus]